MRSIVLICIAMLATSLGAADEMSELRKRRDERERVLRDILTPLLGAKDESYREKLELLHHPQRGSLLFLPGTQFLDSGEEDSSVRKLTQSFARSISRLAVDAATSGHGEMAYQLLHEAAHFDPEEPVSRAVLSTSGVNLDPEVRKSSTKHPRLGWRRNSYWRVTTEHYQVVTSDEQAGIEIAQRLERLHAVWNQLFFDCWSSSKSLQVACENKRRLQPKSRKHRVVLFSSKQAYIDYLEPQQPRIGITLGFYDVKAETSFFFAGPNASSATQLHEATHQLFQEVQPGSVPRIGADANFWIVEGIALYMESLRRRGPYAAVGGFHADRLQFARYRCLQEGFQIPLAELVALGRQALQQHTDIRRLYSQSAGLTHFLMDQGSGQYRSNLIRYLRSVYQGRDRETTLASFLDLDFAELDAQYIAFLNVTDGDIRDALVQPDEMISLCLARTSVTGTTFAELPRQSHLQWLDLSFLPVTDESLSFLSSTTSLRQVSLEGTRITDATMAVLAQHRGIEELDVSHTNITDEGVRHLAAMPNLNILWLTGTKTTDRALDFLEGLAQLEQLDCSKTLVSVDRKQKLRELRPSLSID